MPAVEPVLLPINDMKARYGFGRTRTYELINNKQIDIRRVGGRTFVVDASVKRMLNLIESAA